MKKLEKKLLASLADDELEKLAITEMRVRLVYDAALNRKKRKPDRKIERAAKIILNPRSRENINAFASLSTEGILKQKTMALDYFAAARAIHKDADRTAKRIWQRIIERSREEK